MMKGKVSIVGAGPGDPELITLKGLNAIKMADVILYDALSSEELLEYSRAGTELIYVGKRCGKHSLKQEDINSLILQMTKKHQHVVRLKGGDPFVFGRGHEELSFLKKFNITVDLIPGISSVTSLPLLQEVPLTRRNISESFWVLTGTTKSHELSKDVYLAAKSDATIVILMGMKKLEKISKVFKNERKGTLPVLVISKGATNDEEIAIGTVETIHEEVTARQIGSPGIIIIGEVVSLHPQFIHQYALEKWNG